MEWVKSFIQKEIVGREETNLAGRRHSKTIFCKVNTVLSRRNYSYGRNTLDGRKGRNVLEIINILIVKYSDEKNRNERNNQNINIF